MGVSNTYQVNNMHKEQFDAIEAGRALLSKLLPNQKPSKNTVAAYQREVTRLISRGGALWETAAMTTSQKTWFLRRAAILYKARTALALELARQDQMQHALQRVPPEDPCWKEWLVAVKNIHGLTQFIESAPSGSPLVAPRPRRSKRKTGPGLPDNWRELLAARLPNWRQAYLVAAVTGCRPAELAKGVGLAIEDGQLVATIEGAKVGEHAGQPLRSMNWTLPGTSPLVQQLAEAVQASQGVLTVSLGNRNTNPARAFSDAIREAAARAWPGRKHSITAYSLRHAAASDLKGSGLDAADVSAALGHATLATKSTYGHTKGRKGVSVAPEQVQGSRPVRGQVATWAATPQPSSSPSPQG
ncbi:hypothetical protein BH10PSE16_BH10PSE16_42610 [soil metagenome]